MRTYIVRYRKRTGQPGQPRESHWFILPRILTEARETSASLACSSLQYNRVNIFCLNKLLSTIKWVNSSVPQGSLLGPFLFFIHINRFPDFLSYSDTLLCADDTSLLIVHSNINAIYPVLIEDLINLTLWLNQKLAS